MYYAECVLHQHWQKSLEFVSWDMNGEQQTLVAMVTGFSLCWNRLGCQVCQGQCAVPVDSVVLYNTCVSMSHWGMMQPSGCMSPQFVHGLDQLTFCQSANYELDDSAHKTWISGHLCGLWDDVSLPWLDWLAQSWLTVLLVTAAGRWAVGTWSPGMLTWPWQKFHLGLFNAHQFMRKLHCSNVVLLILDWFASCRPWLRLGVDLQVTCFGSGWITHFVTWFWSFQVFVSLQLRYIKNEPVTAS